MRCEMKTILKHFTTFAVVVILFEMLHWSTLITSDKKAYLPGSSFSYNTSLSVNEKKNPQTRIDSKLVILLANQRTGSTFLAQFFNQDEDTFYMFEPVDALYQALYGTEQGYNVPSDIFFYANGSKRMMPAYEEKYVGDALTALLQCDFENVPIQLLTNKYLDLSHFYFGPSAVKLSPYIKCLIRECGCDTRNQMCHNTIRRICPYRFGTDIKKERSCYESIAGIYNPAKTEHSLPTKHQDALADYTHCIKSLKNHVFRTCIPLLEEKCKKAPVRVIKTVRLTMSTVRYILQKEPSVKTIYLLRDPRSVASSRTGDPSSMTGLYSGADPIKEASLYCTQASNDMSDKKSILNQYPNAVMQVLFEDLVHSPMEYLNKVYSFIGYGERNISQNVVDWVKQNTNHKRPKNEPAKRINKWKTKISNEESEEIKILCSDFYKFVDYESSTNSSIT